MPVHLQPCCGAQGRTSFRKDGNDSAGGKEGEACAQLRRAISAESCLPRGVPDPGPAARWMPLLPPRWRWLHEQRRVPRGRVQLSAEVFHRTSRVRKPRKTTNPCGHIAMAPWRTRVGAGVSYLPCLRLACISRAVQASGATRAPYRARGGTLLPRPPPTAPALPHRADTALLAMEQVRVLPVQAPHCRRRRLRPTPLPLPLTSAGPGGPAFGHSSHGGGTEGRQRHRWHHPRGV